MSVLGERQGEDDPNHNRQASLLLDPSRETLMSAWPCVRHEPTRAIVGLHRSSFSTMWVAMGVAGSPIQPTATQSQAELILHPTTPLRSPGSQLFDEARVIRRAWAGCTLGKVQEGRS